MKDQTLIEAFVRLGVPVAVTQASSDGKPEVVATSKAFDGLVPAAATAIGVLGDLDDLGPRALAAVSGWTVSGSRLPGGAVLWQCVEEVGADDVEKAIAQMLSGALAENLGIIYFGPDRRAKCWSPGMHSFFPDSDVFPIPNGTIEEQIETILSHDMIPGAQGNEDTVRQNLLNGYDKPQKPLVDMTASGLWSISVTCILPNGGRLHVMGDVSDVKRREEQLKTYMSNVDGILFCRRRQGSDRVQVWGRRARRLSSGVEGNFQRIRAEDWFHTFDPEFRQPYIDTMVRHRKTLEPYTFEFGATDPKSGHHMWIREEGWTTEDRFGVIYHDSVLIDITEQREALARHEESEERFRAFAELASDWYFEIDADMCVTYVSERYEELFGVSRETIVGHNWFEIVRADDPHLDQQAALAWTRMRELWDERKPVERIHTPVGSRGARRFVEISSAPVFGPDGTFNGYRGVGRDITEMEEAREQTIEALRHAEEASRAKSAFVANMSHELRTPLNAIIGFSTVMKGELLGPMQNERYLGYVSDIAASGEHLLSLVNDVLDISRVEANKMDIKPEPIELEAEMQGLVELFRDRLDERDFRLVPGDPGSLRADRRALRQMVMNLMSNAIKFTDRGDTISLEFGRTGSGETFISVQDSGCGIREDELAKVLEPFGRAGDVDVTPGTGLGLPLTKQLAELHGGRLELASAFGKGTTVSIIFPDNAG
ncbi:MULTISPECIES: PAS domain-containing sensor histidine kinase [unclassified Minwuia]|jgi:PAS domain S-box-containing protein|uniref:PAS domain-containing sensor histidine kinase n=1 Tax=unclassified Minwuia TaxID=2618799 RepID=UPI00247A26A4|nr:MULTISPECIES: PAS domain-containing sensor histidine kinase [unclassified Minwuia]